MPCLFAFVECDFACARVIVCACENLKEDYKIFSNLYRKDQLSLHYVDVRCIDSAFAFADYFFNEVLNA